MEVGGIVEGGGVGEGREGGRGREEGDAFVQGGGGLCFECLFIILFLFVVRMEERDGLEEEGLSFALADVHLVYSGVVIFP